MKPQERTITTLKQAMGLLDEWIEAYRVLEQDWLWLKAERDRLQRSVEESHDCIAALIDRIIGVD